MLAVTPPEIIERFKPPNRLGGLTVSELHDLTGLPGCFIAELLMNDFQPETAWAETECTEIEPSGKQSVEASFPLPEPQFPLDASPWVCYHTSIQFGRIEQGKFVDLGKVDLQARTWPNISMLGYQGDLYEVTGGQVFQRGGRWWWKHVAYRNTELARHFRGVCGEPYPDGIMSHCVPCRQIQRLRDYGHGNYGVCDRCGGIYPLVPDRLLGPVIPRHRVDLPDLEVPQKDQLCPGGELVCPAILEPKEAKGKVRKGW